MRAIGFSALAKLTAGLIDTVGGGGGGGGITTLAALLDTTITTPQAGDLLQYNGAECGSTQMIDSVKHWMI